MSKTIKITETELQQMIIEAVDEVAVKKKSPLHYWTQKTTCPECGKNEGDAMHGGLCPDCAKAKNKAQSMKGFNENRMHQIVMESVKKMMNEADFSTMPINADAVGRNNWWKQQVDNDFPSHGIENSKDWQTEYNNLQSQKDVEAKAQAKAEKCAKKEEYKNMTRVAYNEFKETCQEHNMPDGPGFVVYSETFDADCFIYDPGCFNLKIKGLMYDDEILVDWSDEIDDACDEDIEAYYIALAANKLSKKLFH